MYLPVMCVMMKVMVEWMNGDKKETFAGGAKRRDSLVWENICHEYGKPYGCV